MTYKEFDIKIAELALIAKRLTKYESISKIAEVIAFAAEMRMDPDHIAESIIDHLGEIKTVINTGIYKIVVD